MCVKGEISRIRDKMTGVKKNGGSVTKVLWTFIRGLESILNPLSTVYGD